MKKHLLVLGVTLVIGLLINFRSDAWSFMSAIIPTLGGLFVMNKLRDENIDNESEIKHLKSIREDLNDHVEGLVRVLDSKDVVISETMKDNEKLKKEVEKLTAELILLTSEPAKKVTKTTTKKTTATKKTK